MQLPSSFTLRMQNSLGTEYSDFEAALHTNPPISIHLHPRKIPSILFPEIDSTVPWYDQGRYLTARPNFTSDPCFHAGAYYVQEASSMVVHFIAKSLLKDVVSPVVLDACAAPGGKSTLLLSILNQQGILVSNEVIQSRVKSLLHNLIKWGYNNHVLTSSDTEKFSTIHNYFDLVLIDAPCSGEGLFRKDQDSIQEWSEHAADLCALRQKRILQNIIPCVKPEGHLIYSTCTYNNLENIEQVHELTTRGMDCVEFEILEKFGFTPIRKNRAIGYQAYPHKVKGEGFFISVLKQTEIVETKSIPAFGNKIKWNPDLTGWEKYADLENQTSFQHNGKYFGFPSDQIHHLETLASITRIIKAGTALGEIKHLEILPDFELSQSVCLSPDVQRSDLERETAIQYLQKNAIANESNLKGYQLISYKGLGLGWAKAIPGRMNNLLPSEYKIKSQYIR